MTQVFGVAGTWDWLLDQLCTITTVNTSLSSFAGVRGVGSSNPGDSTLATTNVPCALHFAGGGETRAHMREEPTDGFTLFLGATQDIRAGDRVTITTPGYKGASTEFRVEGDSQSDLFGSGIKTVSVSRKDK